MKKKLDTRFPAARIKKIMQSDEDVGKIAMAVPLLVSKALELFLQDLCDRTYDITVKRGAKTMSSSHLKQCVQSFNVFDFLKEIVRAVPDLGGSAVVGDDRPIAKRRKFADQEDDDGGEELGRWKMHGMGQKNGSGGGRARGRGRGRGRGQGSQANVTDKFEDDPDMHDEMLDMTLARDGKATEFPESKDNAFLGKNTEACIRNFDLNMDLDEYGNATSTLALGPNTTEMKSIPEITHSEYPEWSVSEMENIVLDPIQLTSLTRPIVEDEDYDDDG